MSRPTSLYGVKLAVSRRFVEYNSMLITMGSLCLWYMSTM